MKFTVKKSEIIPPIIGVVDRFATGTKIGYYLGRKSHSRTPREGEIIHWNWVLRSPARIFDAVDRFATGTKIGYYLGQKSK